MVDESGEDYLYPADWFVAVEIPKVVQASLLKAILTSIRTPSTSSPGGSGTQNCTPPSSPPPAAIFSDAYHSFAAHSLE